MKRIFTYIGSRRGEESNSKKIVDLLMKNISQYLDEEIESDIYYPADININNCLGCCACFTTGKCALDSKDNFNVIKDKMLNADFLIMASPVYAHGVSGDMKTFIDRISYWFHLFRLSGKKSAVISVSSTNGNDYVSSYLKKVMELAGTEVVQSLAVTVDGPKMLESDDFIGITLPFTAKKIAESLKTGAFKPSREQEKFFASMKEIYANMPVEAKEKSTEYKYWKESGMLNSQSLEHYVKAYVSLEQK